MTDQTAKIRALEAEVERVIKAGEKCREDLHVGRELAADLIRRHFVQQDDYDAQLQRLCYWAKVPYPGDGE